MFSAACSRGDFRHMGLGGHRFSIHSSCGQSYEGSIMPYKVSFQ